ncbi:hypothetical protein BABINDRAFT_5497 [Babjeviella inositovora NRRL Y-12698]|uniref:Folylpolyglutamate synthase n=1 Tax=Babjeviella inositovora NRRL Y-12698 TaxID=984486 RepID=A0A1E3QZN3_9ASCO|nr:uncharacterized protein BABINDRAFT_5497 [Babjeviella inositovora NRRL Y-12698]ODQ82547.1 hypothetical protein BABINDRAFT_5497 [Babjeviella inositovora NRRL Y-12698]
MAITNRFQDAVKALNSLQTNFASIEAGKKAGTLKRNTLAMPEMLEWTRRLGYAASDFNRMNIIHITGTKGKGSTCAFVQSILSQYHTRGVNKIGLFTSPHLKSVRERVRINGNPIAEDLFTKYFFEVWDKLSGSTSDTERFPDMAGDSKPVYFKYMTLLSFYVFLKEGVDTAIYEVGVGGEYDSTNIIEKPTVCGVSALGIDHVFMLGETLPEIAWNKGGIFKEGAPAFTVEQPEDAMQVLRARGTEKNIAGELQVVGQNPAVTGLKLGLAGEFQKQNASLAIQLAATHLQKLEILSQTDVEAISRGVLPIEFAVGLETAMWEGRCQTIVEEGVTWYVDGAHTKESIDASSEWFGAVSALAAKPKSRVLLFNQQTRDANMLIGRLYNNLADVKFDHVVFTTNVTWSSGAYSADLVSMNTSKDAVDRLEVQKSLAETWADLEKQNKQQAARKHIFHDIETSVNFIRSLEGPVEVFVCGSLHLVGGFLVVLDGKQ